MSAPMASHQQRRLPRRKRKSQDYDEERPTTNFSHRRIPERWLDYDPVGRDIPGTRIVAFKTPLDASFFGGMAEDDENRFGVGDLIQYAANAGKHFGLVIDLTNTERYYNSKLWTECGVEYVKIRCPGHEVNQHQPLVDQFIYAVNDFFARNLDNEKVVGVHCTHGLNRTGYLICRYLMQCLGWSAARAIKEFEMYRGYEIERKAYISSLYEIESNSSLDYLNPAAQIAAPAVCVLRRGLSSSAEDTNESSLGTSILDSRI